MEKCVNGEFLIEIRVPTGQGKVREKGGQGKVREKSGNLKNGQGKIFIFKKSGKSQGILNEWLW